MIDPQELSKGKEVYWARIIPSYDYFVALPLKVHTIESDYFTGTEEMSKMTFLFSYKTDKVFLDKLTCQNYVNDVRDKYYETHKKRTPTKDTSDEYE